MKTYTHDGKRKLFDEEICMADNVYFHGTHADNAPTVEHEGIKRPRYPQPILKLIEEYRKICLLLGLSHALTTYEKTYEGKQDIVFLTDSCTGAASYAENFGGEMMITLVISANILRNYMIDKEFRQERIENVQKMLDSVWSEEDQKKYQNKLQAIKNIHQYKPLLDTSDEVFEEYPQFFKARSNKGVVYAISPDNLELNKDNPYEGIKTDFVPLKNILAKSTFEIGSIGNPCRACKAKEHAQKGIRMRS